MKVTFNEQSGLFTIPCGEGYTYLGLEVCRQRAAALSGELGGASAALYCANSKDISPLALYADYERLCEIARQRNLATGWRSCSELTPQLIGLEGKRVEIVHQWKSGETETVRFYVGKSAGFIPCHLEIKRRNSSGGGAVCLGEIKSVRIIGSR